MSWRKRFLIFLALALVLALLTALLSPFVIARGLRAWLWWAGQHEGVQVEIGNIEAPFLHPVTLDGLRILPAKEKARRVDLQAAQVTLDLNFRGWLLTKNARFVHAIAVERLRGSNSAGKTTRSGKARVEKSRAAFAGYVSFFRC